jgi:hypothetical protein
LLPSAWDVCRLQVARSVISAVLRVSVSAVAAIEAFTVTLARGLYKVLPSGARWAKVF